jgi:arginine deiminase
MARWPSARRSDRCNAVGRPPLGYHPEHAQDELKHFHQILPYAQSAVERLSQSVKQSLGDFAKRMSQDNANSNEIDAQRQRRLNALDRAQKLIDDVEKQDQAATVSGFDAVSESRHYLQ